MALIGGLSGSDPPDPGCDAADAPGGRSQRRPDLLQTRHQRLHQRRERAHRQHLRVRVRAGGACHQAIGALRAVPFMRDPSDQANNQSDDCRKLLCRFCSGSKESIPLLRRYSRFNHCPSLRQNLMTPGFRIWTEGRPHQLPGCLALGGIGCPRKMSTCICPQGKQHIQGRQSAHLPGKGCFEQVTKPCARQ